MFFIVCDKNKHAHPVLAHREGLSEVASHAAQDDVDLSEPVRPLVVPLGSVTPLGDRRQEGQGAGGPLLE